MIGIHFHIAFLLNFVVTVFWCLSPVFCRLKSPPNRAGPPNPIPWAIYGQVVGSRIQGRGCTRCTSGSSGEANDFSGEARASLTTGRGCWKMAAGSPAPPTPARVLPGTWKHWNCKGTKISANEGYRRSWGPNSWAGACAQGEVWAPGRPCSPFSPNFTHFDTLPSRNIQPPHFGGGLRIVDGGGSKGPQHTIA